MPAIARGGGTKAGADTAKWFVEIDSGVVGAWSYAIFVIPEALDLLCERGGSGIACRGVVRLKFAVSFVTLRRFDFDMGDAAEGGRFNNSGSNNMGVNFLIDIHAVMELNKRSNVLPLKQRH